ncbi:hypothetical protein CYMTET_54384 [Cymbomonas tetramitiformis]|uniref:Uncharacterized protein n=1 Tax=Cymbomonas tetramitiformis TaxID=36881 RepID=A0AAE0BGT9_9CHLO|nr:hypothetical protein CYMTET_54384 [Cymbomonas tetramitiformis]
MAHHRSTRAPEYSERSLGVIRNHSARKQTSLRGIFTATLGVGLVVTGVLSILRTPGLDDFKSADGQEEEFLEVEPVHHIAHESTLADVDAQPDYREQLPDTELRAAEPDPTPDGVAKFIPLPTPQARSVPEAATSPESSAKWANDADHRAADPVPSSPDVHAVATPETPPTVAKRTAAAPTAPPECEDHFGGAYLEKWNEAKRPLCQAGDKLNETPRAGHLACRVTTDHHLPLPTAPHTLCDAGELLVDPSLATHVKCPLHRPGYQCSGGDTFHQYHPGAFGACCTTSDPKGGVALNQFPRDHLRDIFGSFKPSCAKPQLTEERHQLAAVGWQIHFFCCLAQEAPTARVPQTGPLPGVCWPPL